VRLRTAVERAYSSSKSKTEEEVDIESSSPE
jgi:hypothetical protein